MAAMVNGHNSSTLDGFGFRLEPLDALRFGEYFYLLEFFVRCGTDISKSKILKWVTNWHDSLLPFEVSSVGHHVGTLFDSLQAAARESPVCAHGTMSSSKRREEPLLEDSKPEAKTGDAKGRDDDPEEDRSKSSHRKSRRHDDCDSDDSKDSRRRRKHRKKKSKKKRRSHSSSDDNDSDSDSKEESRKRRKKRSSSKHSRRRDDDDDDSSSEEESRRRKKKKHKKRRKRTDSADESPKVRRSVITGKKLKMHIEKDEDYLVQEKARKELLEFMNSGYK